MAQSEDTELRDLVIEALEKNGSLPKIRALLRANIFLAFEDECDSIKQNVNLDNILKLPEGVLALSIVHEFLEFCNLKNTLFVYMSESRQGRDYKYQGRKMLAERLHFINGSRDLKEPILVTFLKNLLQPPQRQCYEQGDAVSAINHNNDQNCTYIVHEHLSTSTSQSTSDNSSDEKNKLHLKLPLDNSDTDTSSDSTREKSSEYIPNQHVLSQVNAEVQLSPNQPPNQIETIQETSQSSETLNRNSPYYIHGLKTNTNNSSDSTSYVDIKPYIPTNQQNLSPSAAKVDVTAENSSRSPGDLGPWGAVSSASLSTVSSLSSKNENAENKIMKSNSRTADEHIKSDTEATEYSLDFTSSPSKNINNQDGHLQSPEQVQDNQEKSFQIESPKQNSQSSQSSISISDVADLIDYSDKNNFFEHSSSKDNLSGSSQSKASRNPKHVSGDQNKPPSEDSGDFSESPVPSLSNLSLDVHSD